MKSFPFIFTATASSFTRIGGKATAGVFKDVVMLGGYQEAEVCRRSSLRMCSRYRRPCVRRSIGSAISMMLGYEPVQANRCLDP